MTTLSEALRTYGNRPYLLTIGEDAPHTSQTHVAYADGTLSCPLSKSAATNVRQRPHISLLWPPTEQNGYSIIMNGTVQNVAPGEGDPIASITLTKAVFHRPGPSQPGKEGTTCTSDCKPIAIE